MGNIYSSPQIKEYQQKIEDLDKRVLELEQKVFLGYDNICLLYTSPSPRD